MQNTESRGGSNDDGVAEGKVLILSAEQACQLEQRLAIMLGKTSWVTRQESIASFSSDLEDTIDIEFA